MPNIALDEANALQARIDALVKQRDSIKPEPSKLRKEYDELYARLEKIQEQVSALADEVITEETVATHTVHDAQAKLDYEVSILTTGRDALLQRAQSRDHRRVTEERHVHETITK